MTDEYDIVFEKLAQVKNEMRTEDISESGGDFSDSEEIEELRKIINDINADAEETIVYTRA